MLTRKQDVYAKLENIHGAAKLAAAVSGIGKTAADLVGPTRRDDTLAGVDKVRQRVVQEMAIVC